MKQILIGFCLVCVLGVNWEVGAYNEEDLAKLLATGECPNCDLEGVKDLSWAILIGADLSGANLTGADLSEANLTGAVFCNTTMPDRTISNAGC